MVNAIPTRVLHVAAIVVGLATVWFVWRWAMSPSADDLVEVALNGPSVTAQTQAAIGLVSLGDDALEGLRRVAAQSTEPSVKVACIEGLAKLWDYDSMDMLIELAENGDTRVRGRAAQAIMRMTGRHRRFVATAPESQRKLLAKHMRADWKEIKSASDANRDELKRRLRESYEKAL
jgi:enoyl-CoA hydratase/carnithine racemase